MFLRCSPFISNLKKKKVSYALLVKKNNIYIRDFLLEFVQVPTHLHTRDSLISTGSGFDFEEAAGTSDPELGTTHGCHILC